MTIDGYAYIPDSSEPGKLLLHFDSVPTDGPYWILEYGPIVNGIIIAIATHVNDLINIFPPKL